MQQPFQVGDIIYPDKRSVRRKLSQIGAFSSGMVNRRIDHVKLQLFDKMRTQDITLRSALDYFTSYIISTIGDISHPDKEIEAFHNNNIRAIQDEHGTSFTRMQQIMLETKYWAGNSVSEIMFDFKFGSLIFKNLLTYHPSTIILRHDLNGMLSEGKPTHNQLYKSGIYQRVWSELLDFKERKLKFWKHIYLAYNSEFGNYYGQSLMGPAYKWWRLKEELIMMYTDFLDKASRGRRTIIASQTFPTENKYFDPSTGEERIYTTSDLLREELKANPDSDTILLTKQNLDQKIDIHSLPLVDNFGANFLEAIAFADQESVRHFMPYFLITDVSRNSLNEVAKERRMEVFYQITNVERELLLRALVNKIFMPLQAWNFNRESAKIPPTFNRIYNNRPEDRVETMQFLKGTSDIGLLNLQHHTDWQAARQMVGFPERAMEDQDVQNVDKVFIAPKQKKPRAADAGPSGSGKPGRTTGVSKPQQQRRMKVV